jgi:NADPH:quinone reductase-like Zn-dependent oxidoreductase
MKAAVLKKLGETPTCEEFQEPVAKDGEAIVAVRAASLKQVDRQLADGSHFASPRELPIVCGTDGVGTLDDGRRVFFGGTRPPFGTMAERTVVNRQFCFPVPDELDDATAAALPNPGVSAWLTLGYRAKLKEGENVLILGATGVTGKLAVRIAKLMGAARVVAAGRNPQALEALRSGGADATIRIGEEDDELREAFAREAANSRFDVIIDYLWGRPTEVLLSALTKKEFAHISGETRVVQAGESAGAAISLPAAVLRSSALTILGTAGIPPREVLAEALTKVMALGDKGELKIETERVRLADIERAWRQVRSGTRTVIVP